MYDFESSLIIGFCLCGTLFLLCFFVVVIVKYLLYFITKLLAPKIIPAPKKPRKRIKSIEINPNEIDRIYVKKTG